MRVRNVSSEAASIPGWGVIAAGQEAEVPDGMGEGLCRSALFKAVEPAQPSLDEAVPTPDVPEQAEIIRTDSGQVEVELATPSGEAVIPVEEAPAKEEPASAPEAPAAPPEYPAHLVPRPGGGYDLEADTPEGHIDIPVAEPARPVEGSN